MPVSARLSRYKASLLDKKPLSHPSARRTWSWSAGSAVGELALLEAQQYLANDWDAETVFLDTALYDARGDRASSGIWEASDEVYDPQAVIKQAKYAKLPYVEVKVAIPGQWLDTAIKLRSGAVKTGHRLVPVARKGYKLAREQVRKHRPPQDRIGTHTAQARLHFDIEEHRWDAFKEQLDKAGVLMSEDELAVLRKTAEAALKRTAEAASDAEREATTVEPNRGASRAALTDHCPACDRILGAEGVSCHSSPAEGWVCDRVIDAEACHERFTVWAKLAYPSYARVLENGYKVHLANVESPHDQILCGQRLAEAPKVALPGELLFGIHAGPSAWRPLISCDGCYEAFAEAQKAVAPSQEPQPEDSAAVPEVISQEEQMAALRDRARLVDSDGVMHLAWVLMIDPERLRLQNSRSRCDFRKGLADGERRFQSSALPDDPTPAGAVSVCLACASVPAVAVAQPQDSAPEAAADGDDLPSGGAPSAMIYMPRLLKRSGLVGSTDLGFYLINSGNAVTVDGVHVNMNTRADSLVGKMLMVRHASRTRAAMAEWVDGRLVAREIPLVEVNANAAHIYLPSLMVQSGMTSSEHEAFGLIRGNWVDISPGFAGDPRQLNPDDGFDRYLSPARLDGARVELRPGHPASAHPESKPVVHSFAVLSQGQTDDVTGSTPVEYDVWDDLGSPQPYDHQDDPRLDEV